MTLISPTNYALKEKLNNAAQEAKLNLSEVNALNEQYGVNLEYAPQNDTIELTTYASKNSKEPDDFTTTCNDEALLISKETGKPVKEYIKPTKTSSFEENLKSAINKLKNVLTNK